MKNLRKRLRAALAAALFVLALLLSPALCETARASGYGSWIQDSDAYREFYGTTRTTTGDSDAPEDDENFLIKALAALIHYVGAKANNSDKSGDANLSIDGIIMGKVGQPGGVSYVSFDLSPGNVYGTAGATVYVIFRGLAYSAMIIAFAVLLLKALVNSSPKAREELKQGCCAIVVNFALIYLMPQVIDLAIFLRDVLLVRILEAMGSKSSITDALEAAYQADKSLISAVVFTAAVCASLFYLKDYVSIAIQQTVLFGFFCVFTVMGVFKKKFLSDWCNMFFSNLLVPVVDLACIMMPYAALKTFGAGGRRLGFAQALIILFMVWSARAARVQMMRLFGSVTGSPAGRGLAGLATMAQLARMARARKKGDGGAEGKRTNGERFEDWQEEKERQGETAEGMNGQAREISRGLGDLDDGETFERPGGSEAEDFVASQEDDAGPAPDAGGEGDLEGDAGPGEEREGAGEAFGEGGEAGPESAEGDDAGALNGGDVSPSEEPPLSDAFSEEAGSPDLSEEAGGDAPPMTEFERRRYANLRQMDSLRDSIEEANGFADENAAQNAAIDGRLNDLEDAEEVLSKDDRGELSRLDGESASIREAICANEADEGRLSALSAENEEIDRLAEGASEGERETLLARRAQNDAEAAQVRARVDERTDGCIRAANESDEGRLAALYAERNALDEKMKGADGPPREGLLLQRRQCEEGIQRTRERMSSRGRDLSAELLRNDADGEAIREGALSRKAAVEEETRNLRHRRDENARQAADARRQAGRMRESLSERERAEGRFAQASRDYGRDATRYQSSEDMRLAVERRNEKLEAARIAAARRGGITRDALRDLSPEGAAEVAAIQSEAIRNANVRKAIAGAAKTAAGVAVVTAGAAVGAAVMAYGGEDASLTGAYLAGSAAGGVAGAAAGAAKKAWEAREEIAADAKDAGRAAAEAARAAYERDKKTFLGGARPPAGKDAPKKRPEKKEPPKRESPREALSREAEEALKNRDEKAGGRTQGGVREALIREAEDALYGRDKKS